MPDISYNFSVVLSKGNLAQTFNAPSITASMSTAGMFAATLDLGTAVTQLSTATLGSLGLCIARSLATTTTHTISFGRYDGTNLHDVVRLRAGEAAVLRLAPGDYAAKAAVQGSRLLIHITED